MLILPLSTGVARINNKINVPCSHLKHSEKWPVALTNDFHENLTC